MSKIQSGPEQQLAQQTPAMNHDDHCLRVGYIHMNLTALESALRFFLLKANNEKFSPPKPDDKEAPLSHFTNRASLGWLIKEYNGKLSLLEKVQFELNDKTVRVRDALAHGRLVAPTLDFPLTLWKFGQVKAGHVPIEFNDVLTITWLDDAKKMIFEQKELVVACSKGRGYGIA